MIGCSESSMVLVVVIGQKVGDDEMSHATKAIAQGSIQLELWRTHALSSLFIHKFHSLIKDTR
ncbi:hypothetical protein HanIR_Chr03g0111541 [Helianthus annuus]|nr:hypothetical protein HanIR_Chr03g0111541 [Helianthus annuus]